MANEEILSLKIKDDGTIYDECGHTVTKENGTTQVLNIDGRKCMYFNDGNYLKIITDDTFNLTGDFTIEFWLKLDGTCINQSNHWPCIINTKYTWGTGSISFLVCTQDWVNQIGFSSHDTKDHITIYDYNNPTNWQYVSFVCKDNRYFIYVNGKLQSNIKDNNYDKGINLNHDGFITIGKKGLDDGNTGSLHGYVSDLKISTFAKNTTYIKQDNKYYGFSDDNYDTTTKMYKEVTLDNIKNLKYSNLIFNLTKETTVGDETFKPINKFTNFQIISPCDNNPKTVIGSKSKSGLIVANGDIYAGKISDRINSFTLEYTVNNNSAIKMAVSFDNGSTWKTYKDGAFQELSITIPNKYYANMTDEEKTNYSNAKTTILENGFNASNLSSIDFNIDNLNTIRFAYVLYQDSINDDCKMSDLSWNFNAKGYLQKMKDSEVDTSFCNGIIKITPLIDCEMIITNYNY